jgi:hypothetical protein
MHFEGLVLHGLPFVETGLAEGDAAGFGLAAGVAGSLEVDDVGHVGGRALRLLWVVSERFIAYVE